MVFIFNYKKWNFFFQEHDDDFIDVDGQYSDKKRCYCIGQFVVIDKGYTIRIGQLNIERE